MHIASTTATCSSYARLLYHFRAEKSRVFEKKYTYQSFLLLQRKNLRIPPEKTEAPAALAAAGTSAYMGN
jgi:hypothetical protein